MFVGGLEMVKGTSAAASFNYVEAAAHFAAGAFAFIQGGLMMGGTPPSGGGGGGGGGVGGPGGAQFATGGSAGAFGSGPSSNIPASPNGSPPNGTGGGAGASGGTSVSIGTISVIGSIDDDSAMKIKQGLQDLDLTQGGISS
jgi:hypothetical protein